MVDPKVWEDINNCRDPWGGTLENLDLSALPEPLQTTLWQKVHEFAGKPMSNYLKTHLAKAMKAADERLRWWMRRDPANPSAWLISFHLDLPFPPPGTNSVKHFRRFPEGTAPRLAVGMLWERRAVQRVEPDPVAGCSGVVTVEVLVGTDGRVIDAYVDEGPEQLHEAALQAARQWTFKTYAQAGHAFEVQTYLRIEFPISAC